MAASDYEIRGTGQVLPYGELQTAVAHLDTVLTVKNLNSNDTTPVEVGDAALLNDELVKVVAVTLPTITVERGCADTIPQAHAVNSPIWFFSNNLPSDTREYPAESTVGVKLLPFTISGEQTPIEYVDPFTLTFNWRFIRPYAPGNFKCQGSPWFNDPFVVPSNQNDLVFTWAHRDRILQADQLIGHLAGNYGPEPGTTYVAKVYSQQHGLRRTVTGITGTTWTYTRAMAEADLSTGGFGYVVIYAVRDGHESLAQYRTDFEFQGVTGLWEVALTFSGTSYTPPDGDNAILQFDANNYTPPISN